MASFSASLDAEVKQIQRAVERIMFDEVIKGIFAKEIKKCAGMVYEEAYNQVILQAVPRVEDTVGRHVSFTHIFDENSKRLGLYDCPSFIQKLVAILDDRVSRGIEVIPGGKLGNDFDMQLRFALVKLMGGEMRPEQEKFLRGPAKATTQADMHSRSEKEVASAAGKPDTLKKNYDGTSTGTGASKETSFRRARK